MNEGVLSDIHEREPRNLKHYETNPKHLAAADADRPDADVAIRVA